MKVGKSSSTSDSSPSSSQLVANNDLTDSKSLPFRPQHPTPLILCFLSVGDEQMQADFQEVFKISFVPLHLWALLVAAWPRLASP